MACCSGTDRGTWSLEKKCPAVQGISPLVKHTLEPGDGSMYATAVARRSCGAADGRCLSCAARPCASVLRAVPLPASVLRCPCSCLAPCPRQAWAPDHAAPPLAPAVEVVGPASVQQQPDAAQLAARQAQARASPVAQVVVRRAEGAGERRLSRARAEHRFHAVPTCRVVRATVLQVAPALLAVGPPPRAALHVGLAPRVASLLVRAVRAAPARHAVRTFRVVRVLVLPARLAWRALRVSLWSRELPVSQARLASRAAERPLARRDVAVRRAAGRRFVRAAHRFRAAPFCPAAHRHRADPPCHVVRATALRVRLALLAAA